MALAVIVQKKWTYTLYKDDQGMFVLSVLCGGASMYELNIPLSTGEAQSAMDDAGFLDGLVETIRAHPHDYAEKSIRI